MSESERPARITFGRGRLTSNPTARRADRAAARLSVQHIG
jgi:hypothetical protein